MHKGVSLFLSLCLVLSVLTAALPSQVLAAGLTSFDLTLTYTDTNVNNGIVDRKDTATTAKVTMDDMMTLQVTPNPESTNASTSITLDHWSYASHNLDIESLKSISFYCYYTGNASLGKPQLRVLRGSTQALTAAVTVTAREAIKKEQWIWVEFDLSTALEGKTVAGTVLSQFHFLPFGPSGTPGVLTTDDVVNIAQIRLSSTALDPLPPEEPEPVVNYTIRFRPGRPDVTGNNPQADTSLAPGATFKMPRNTYSRSGYTFSHYICTADTNTYSASTSSWYNNGATFTVPDNKTGGGRAGADQVIYFMPVFKKNSTTVTGLPEVLSANYSDYHNATSAGVTATKAVPFDGRTTLQVTPNPSSTSTEKLSLAGWNWDAFPWNMDYYKYITVEYYFETTNNNLSTYKPQFRMLTVGGALWDIQIVASKETVVANRWALLTYDLSNVSLNSNVSSGNHVLNQMHYWWQPDGGKPSDFAAGSKIYIGKITMYHTKPSTTPQLVEKYMDGDTNGNFRPHDKLTRAEAAKVLYNILKNYSLLPLPNDLATAFSDVSTSDWFFTSVATLERLGIIPKEASFMPNSPITKRDFAIYVQNLFHKIGGSETLAGVTLAGGDAITREEAVSILNRLVFGELCWELPEPLGNARVVRFADVHPSVWSYNDIVAATSPRVSTFAGGVESPIALLTDTLDPVNDPEAYDTTTGDAKILEIDAQTASRIAAIRATANTIDPASVTTGTVYYVSSSSGSTSNPGTSADAPYLITSLSSVNSKIGNTTIKSGDVILFKRGDTFRGALSTISGVTYSAYGTGDKPVFIRNTEEDAGNPANWTLDYENTATGAKIWTYKNGKSVTEAGAINLIGSDGSIVVAYKELPSYKSGSWWVRGKTSSVAYDYKVELDRDLEYVQLDPPNGSSGNCVPQTGPIYLRCDAGNPGSLYSRIEFNMRGNCISAKNDVTIDNICILFFGSHGIGAGSAKNLTVTNCEIGWGGGANFYYQMSSQGQISRYGNGVEIYGGLKNYTIENCYVYQIYDAGITHQISATSAGNYIMDGVTYRNNVLEYSTYNIEYFVSADNASTTSERYMKDVAIDNNIIRKAGYGWGFQRPDSEPANIKGWVMPNKELNFTVTNNVIDRTYNKDRGNGIRDWLAQLTCENVGCEAYLSGNTFIQVPGRLCATIGQTTFKHNSGISTSMSGIGAVNCSYYFCAEGLEEAKLDTVYRGVMP